MSALHTIVLLCLTADLLAIRQASPQDIPNAQQTVGEELTPLYAADEWENESNAQSTRQQSLAANALVDTLYRLANDEQRAAGRALVRQLRVLHDRISTSDSASDTASKPTLLRWRRDAESNTTNEESQTAGGNETSFFQTIVDTIDTGVNLWTSVDQTIQPLTVPITLVCDPCGVALAAARGSACVWQRRQAVLNLGLNMQTADLGLCSVHALWAGGTGTAAVAYGALQANRTFHVVRPLVEEYWWGSGNESALGQLAEYQDIGWGTFWSGNSTSDESTADVQSSDSLTDQEPKSEEEPARDVNDLQIDDAQMAPDKNELQIDKANGLPIDAQMEPAESVVAPAAAFPPPPMVVEKAAQQLVIRLRPHIEAQVAPRPKLIVRPLW